MLKPYALRLPTATVLLLVRELLLLKTGSRTVLCGGLYTACVDASRTVFWDRSAETDLFVFSFCLSLCQNMTYFHSREAIFDAVLSSGIRGGDGQGGHVPVKITRLFRKCLI